MFCLLSAVCYMFFFFQQKTAYEMLIGDSSSDVCSSDLMLCDVGFDIVRRRDRQSAALGRGLALKSRAPEVDDAGASRNIVAVYAGSVESGFCHVGVVECRGRDVAIQHDDFLHAGPNKRAPVDPAVAERGALLHEALTDPIGRAHVRTQGTNAD